MYGTTDELRKALGFQVTAMEAGKEEGAFDTELEDVLTNVSAMIDGMICNKVAPADVANNAVLKRIALAVARFDVWGNYARNQMPEAVLQDKKEAMQMLKEIQTGKISLQADTPGEDAVTIVTPEFSETAAVFGTIML